MFASLILFEYWLFSQLVKGHFISTQTMDKWIERLRVKDGPLSNVTIYLNSSILKAQVKHPNLKRVNTIDQLCAVLEDNSEQDVVFMGQIDSSIQRSLLVSGAKLVVEDNHANPH